MKLALIYLYVAGKSDATAPPPEEYRERSVKFSESYYALRGTVPHDLFVVSCGMISHEPENLFPDCNRFMIYTGGGWDIGAHQVALKAIPDYDFAICFNTGAYFSKEGFLEAMLKARETYGDGMYGASSSFENSPHIRTTSWGVDPKTFRDYGILVDNRAKTFEAESGYGSITNWYRFHGKPTVLVAPSGCYHLMESRKVPNVFRRGDQSDTFVRDRHHDWWETTHPEQRDKWATAADSKPV